MKVGNNPESESSGVGVVRSRFQSHTKLESSGAGVDGSRSHGCCPKSIAVVVKLFFATKACLQNAQVKQKSKKLSEMTWRPDRLTDSGQLRVTPVDSWRLRLRTTPTWGRLWLWIQATSNDSDSSFLRFWVKLLVPVLQECEEGLTITGVGSESCLYHYSGPRSESTRM